MSNFGFRRCEHCEAVVPLNEWGGWAEYHDCKGGTVQVVEARIAAAVAAERERCARVAETATTGLTGFVEPDRMEFAVRNMAKLRTVIADRIRSGEGVHSHDRLPPGQARDERDGGQ